MQVKNISGHDISFMFQSPKSTSSMPVFDTVNLVTGWTVEIAEDIWNILSKQTTSISTFTEEVEPITEGKPTIKGFGSEAVVPSKLIRTWSGTSKTVNLIDHLVKTRQIELVRGEEVALPQRSVMESFLKRHNEKFTSAMTDEELMNKVRVVKSELEALKDL